MEDLCIFNVVSIQWHRPRFLGFLQTQGATLIDILLVQIEAWVFVTQLTDVTDVFVSAGSFSFVSRKVATSICLLFLMGMKRSPPILDGVCFLFLPINHKKKKKFLKKTSQWLTFAKLSPTYEYKCRQIHYLAFCLVFLMSSGTH